MPESMGKIISCLFSFKTLKLFMASVQPLDKRSKKLIEFVLVMNINIRNHFLKQLWHPVGKIILWELHLIFCRFNEGLKYPYRLNCVTIFYAEIQVISRGSVQYFPRFFFASSRSQRYSS